MGAIEVKSAADCRYDILSLGEVMLRLDPGEGRIRTARNFRAWEGGGEYNVARGLRRCFGQRAAIVTALARNDVGLLIEDFLLQGGVDPSLIKWAEYDGIGRTVRNGLNFTERGFGIRTPHDQGWSVEIGSGLPEPGHTVFKRNIRRPASGPVSGRDDGIERATVLGTYGRHYRGKWGNHLRCIARRNIEILGRSHLEA